MTLNINSSLRNAVGRSNASLVPKNKMAFHD
jgi:hypothetical protein